MSVEYTSNFGLGYKIPEIIDCDNISDFLTDITDGTNYKMITFGDFYSGDISYCVVFKDTFNEIMNDLQKNIDELSDFLIITHNINLESEIGIVGGLEIS